MRILVLFGGRLDVSRGTPSRARNMALALAARTDVELEVLSRDSRLEIPGAVHRSLTETTLPAAVASFRPAVVYGHTHKALPELAALEGCLRVVDLHGDPVAEKLEERGRSPVRRWRSAAHLWLIDRRFTHRVDGATVVSSLLARRTLRRGLPTRLLWGGVDPTLFAPSTASSEPGLVVGYAGNFRPYQGLPTLIEAAHRLIAGGADLRLLLIGDPGDSGVDRLAVERLGARVELTGPLAYEDVPATLGRADVLVIPRPDSRTARAGFPSKLLEYMALGKALVVTDVGDQAAAVDHGKTGLVIAPGDPVALAEALDSLRQPRVRDRLGRSARAAAEGPFSWSSIGDELVDFFSQLAA